MFGLLICCILVAMVMTGITGLLYNWLRLPSLVLTLGLCIIYEALVSIIGDQVYIKKDMMLLGKEPWCFLIFAVGFVIMYLIMNKTVFGNNVKAIGANQTVAASTGMNIARTKFLSFLLGGFYLGLAAVMYASANGIVEAPGSLESLTPIFDAMMGVFIGNFLANYCNPVIGVAIGAFTMKMLSVALVAVGMTSSTRDIITGVFLVILLCISSNRGVLARMRERKRSAQQADLEYRTMAD